MNRINQIAAEAYGYFVGRLAGEARAPGGMKGLQRRGKGGLGPGLGERDPRPLYLVAERRREDPRSRPQQVPYAVHVLV